MTRILSLYRNAFGGLSIASWMLALIMFINRAGAMVVPFLSVYLTESLHFSLKQAGIILSLFGLGATCGAFLGGWLTDKIGHFKVQLTSLILSSGMFLIVLQLHTFQTIGTGIFFLSLIAECLRPANASSVAYYAKPENVTRAFSLNRMASNLGFSIGPALGGLLATISFKWLFIGDSVTCLAAAIFFYFYFRRQPGSTPFKETEEKSIVSSSPYKDLKFICFVVLCCCFATIFFQFVSTLPLYYRRVYQLSENNIGLLLALNGILVFSLEMVAVYILSRRFKLVQLIVSGCILVGFSFVVLNLLQAPPVLYLAMVILSFSEILAMPFMSTIAVQRSSENNRGAYMGLYVLSYSAAHVVSPFLGTNIIASYGFEMLWWVLGGMALVTAVGFYLLIPRLLNE